MNIDDFKGLSKDISNNVTFSSIVSNFIKELSQALNKKDNNQIDIQKFKEGDINLVWGLNNENVTLLNPKTGEEKEIYVSISKEITNKLNNEEIYNNIYEMESQEFCNWDLGTKLIMENGSFKIYNGEIEIKDDDVWYELKEMEAHIKNTENTKYIVKNISDDRIYLTHENGSSYFSVYKELYSDLELGEVVKKINGKYIKENLE